MMEFQTRGPSNAACSFQSVPAQIVDMAALTVPSLFSYYTGGSGPSEGIMSQSYDGASVTFSGYGGPIGACNHGTCSDPFNSASPAWYANGVYETFNQTTLSSPSYLAWLKAQKYQLPSWSQNTLPRVVSTLTPNGKITNIANTPDNALGDTFRGTCSIDGRTVFAAGHGMPLYVPSGPNAGKIATAAEGAAGTSTNSGDALVAYTAGHQTRVTSSPGYTVGTSAVIVNSSWTGPGDATTFGNLRACHFTNVPVGGGSASPDMK